VTGTDKVRHIAFRIGVHRSYFLWKLGKVVLTYLNFQQNPEDSFETISRTAFFYMNIVRLDYL